MLPELRGDAPIYRIGIIAQDIPEAGHIVRPHQFLPPYEVTINEPVCEEGGESDTSIFKNDEVALREGGEAQTEESEGEGDLSFHR
jgi:hypothetical protein